MDILDDLYKNEFTFIRSATNRQPSAISGSVTVTTCCTSSHKSGKVFCPTFKNFLKNQIKKKKKEEKRNVLYKLAQEGEGLLPNLK